MTGSQVPIPIPKWVMLGIPVNELLNEAIPLPLVAIYTMIASTLIFTVIFSIVLLLRIIQEVLTRDRGVGPN
jgi:hypothetical protein